MASTKELTELTKYAVMATIIMAIVTYIPRVLPLILVRSKINSVFILSFLYYVPFAVLGALTFPSIFYSTNNYLTATMGTFVALWLAYRRKSLMIVAISAIVTVYLSGLILGYL